MPLQPPFHGYDFCFTGSMITPGPKDKPDDGPVKREEETYEVHKNDDDGDDWVEDDEEDQEDILKDDDFDEEAAAKG